MVLLRTDDEEIIERGKDLLDSAGINSGEMWAMRGQYLTCSFEDFYEAIEVLRDEITRDQAVTFY